MNKSGFLSIFLILSTAIIFSFVSAEDLDTEQVACGLDKLDYDFQLSSDIICNVNYNGVDASCIIKASSDSDNICYPTPTISIIKPLPDEGYMSIPGLSGNFDGLLCSEIETAYNTNNFFVTCKHPGEINNDEGCFDSDGNIIYYTKGYTIEGSETTSVVFNKDKCEADGTLAEFYCEGDSSKRKSYTCFGGCEDGACLKCTESSRQKDMYCSSGEEWLIQKKSGDSCVNNYECSFGSCSSGSCRGFFETYGAYIVFGVVIIIILFLIIIILFFKKRRS